MQLQFPTPSYTTTPLPTQPPLPLHAQAHSPHATHTLTAIAHIAFL